MSVTLDNFNTSIEAHKLVKDPTKLFSLLYSKYGDILEEYQTSLINQIIFKCSTHLNTQYQEIRYNNIFLEFLRRFYKKKEVKERVPNLYEYYKNYHLFYLKPVLRNFYYVKLLHNYQDRPKFFIKIIILKQVMIKAILMIIQLLHHYHPLIIILIIESFLEIKLNFY